MTDEASARGRRSRRKGHDFERHVAALLRDLGVDARRTIQSRGGGKEGADIAVEGYHIEAKTGACPNLWAAWAQAQADAAGSGRVPVVVAHREAPAFERAAEVMIMQLDRGAAMLGDDCQIHPIRGPRLNLWAAMANAHASTGPGRVPVVLAYKTAADSSRLTAAAMVLPLDVGLGMLAACIRAAKGEG